MITIDSLLENRVKVGKFQYITLGIVSLIDFADGIEKTVVGTLLSILKFQWKLSSLQVQILASSYFVGIVFGTLLCAFFADKFGRARTLQYSSLIAFLLLLWHSLVQSFWEVLALRFLFGIIFGTTIPLGHIVISEIVPGKIRGAMMSIVSFIFIIGKIYCTLLQMIFLDNYEQGRWRSFLFVNSIPLLICFLLSSWYLRESPRFYFMNQNFEDGFKEIEKIGTFNQKIQFALTDQEKAALMEQQNELKKIQTNQVNVKHLFSKQYRSFTIRMWIVFMLTSIIETTLYILMPFWLSDYNKGFVFQLYMMIAELMAAIAVYFIIDSKKTGGRSKLVVFISLLICAVSCIVYVYGTLIFGLSTISFLLKIMFTAEMVIMNENYITQYRSMGVGMTQTMGKLMGVVCPYFIFTMFDNNPYSPFLLYGASMLILSFLAFTFPFDMTQKELDTVDVFQKQNPDSLVQDAD